MQFDKDLNSEYAQLYLDVREFLTKEIECMTDKVWEKYSENITTIYCKEFCSAFCYLRVKDDYVHIGWFNGSKIVDRYGFLFGNGKQIRGHKVKILNSEQKKAISFYVRESYFCLLEKHELKRARR